MPVFTGGLSCHDVSSLTSESLRMLRKMAWEAAKQKFLQMSLAERRAQYKTKTFVELSSIPPFNFGPSIRQNFGKTF